MARMDPERLPVQVLFGWIEGKRPIGRPIKTRIDTVRDDLRFLSDLKHKRGTFTAICARLYLSIPDTLCGVVGDWH